LTKKFADRTAVNDVSFEVGRGEVVGFLGPNGAGKTTTMRVLTGFLPPTGGTVKVAGFDVTADPLEVRRRIGYLPENCPLYPEMRVDEYLCFRGRLKGLGGRSLKTRLAEVKEQCGIADVGRRIVGQLSKGYRQRVGLAETLIHDPELLILDEPTIGLDPNQIRQVRSLIGDLAKRHTILLSTHILSEVEMTCRRVLIINGGRIVASDTPDGLRARLSGQGRVVAEIRGPADLVSAALRGLPGVTSVGVEGTGEWLRFTIACDKGVDPRPGVFESVVRGGWALRELGLEVKTLEDIFVTLTRSDQAEAAGDPPSPEATARQASHQ
jgi:ABC-2 type transport system ATP-binding protein